MSKKIIENTAKKTYSAPDPFKSGDTMKKAMNRLNIDADTAESYLRRINNIVSINKNYIVGMNPHVLILAMQMDDVISSTSGVPLNEAITDFLNEQNYQGASEESIETLKTSIIRYYFWMKILENNPPTRDYVPKTWIDLWTPQDLYVNQKSVIVEASDDIIS